MNTSFYSQEELEKIGFKSLGKNVCLSKKVSIYGADKISIGDNSRIDDFCILSGKIEIGRYVHVSAYTALYGADFGITFADYSGISARGTVYAASDDFSGEYMTNSTLPDEVRNVISESVMISRFCQVGAGCTILPGSILNEGVAVGSMSLIKGNLSEWMIYAGVPCKPVKERSRRILHLYDNLKSNDEI